MYQETEGTKQLKFLLADTNEINVRHTRDGAQRYHIFYIIHKDCIIYKCSQTGASKRG